MTLQRDYNNPYVVSLLEAVRRHYCFGLIHGYTCTIINLYNVRMLLITKVIYKRNYCECMLNPLARLHDLAEDTVW